MLTPKTDPCVNRAVLISKPNIDMDLFLRGALESFEKKLVQDTLSSNPYRIWINSLREFGGNVSTHVPLTFMVLLYPADAQEFQNRIGDLAIILNETPSGLWFGVVSGYISSFESLCRENKGSIWSDIDTAVRGIFRA